jgi:membrane-bound lytic murein transglycosylase D
LPVARQALGLLDQIENGAPYADWLRQRLDYLDASYRALTVFRSPAPPAVGKPPRPPPPELQRKRNVFVGSRTGWRRRLADRPMPERATALVPRLKAVFKSHGVPPELVWLAEVESTFNPEARSPVGAVGLFQFMPKTAESLGVKTKPEDERIIPEKSATAAAKYLKYLHGRFHTWPLAFAAYNAGEGRISGLLKKHRAAKFSQISDHVPSETRMYVPKVLATIALREKVDPERLPAPSGK